MNRNLAVFSVYWFLMAIALACALFGVREAYRAYTRKPSLDRIAGRNMRVEIREMIGKRSRYRAPFAVADLRMESQATHTVDAMITKEELISQAFLDRWMPGTILEPESGNGWLPVLALGIGMWMFGTFAWMTKPFIYDSGTEGMGVKFLALALLPVGAAAFGISQNVSKSRAENAIQRQPVDGIRRTMPVDEWMKEWASLDVQIAPDVRQFLDTEEIDFCEYSWNEKKWRSASIWCQPPPGENGAGHINPANPRDVKWGAEP